MHSYVINPNAIQLAQTLGCIPSSCQGHPITTMIPNLQPQANVIPQHIVVLIAVLIADSGYIHARLSSGVRRYEALYRNVYI